MASVDININNLNFILRGDETEEHLSEVAEIVRRKLENARQRNASLSVSKATMLVAFDLASELIKGRKKALQYRNEVISRTANILEKVESVVVSGPALKPPPA